MKVAIPYENGEIFQHFGKAPGFKIYDINAENGEIEGSQIVQAGITGHHYMAEILKNHEVTAVICGGIGGRACDALANADIAVYAGIDEDPDKAAEAFAHGELKENPEAVCAHHNSAHGRDHDCHDSHSCCHS